MVKGGEGLSIKSLVILKPNTVSFSKHCYLSFSFLLPAPQIPSPLWLVQLQFPRASPAIASVQLPEGVICFKIALKPHAYQKIETEGKGREEKHIRRGNNSEQNSQKRDPSH